MHNHLLGTAGPMGASVDDLVTGMICQLDPKIHMLDPYCPPSPWRDSEYQEVQNDKAKMKIGILAESKLFPCSEAVRRAMKIAEKKLIELGYDVVQVSFTDEEWRQGSDYFFSIVANGAALSIAEEFEEVGEPQMPTIKKNSMILRAGFLMRPIIELALVL